MELQHVLNFKCQTKDETMTFNVKSGIFVLKVDSIYNSIYDTLLN